MIKIIDLYGNCIQNNSDEIKFELSNIGYSDKESNIVSKFIIKNKVTTNKDNLMIYKNEIIRLVYILNDLNICVKYASNNNIEKAINYMKESKNINHLLNSVLCFYNENVLSEFVRLVNIHWDLLLLKLS